MTDPHEQIRPTPSELRKARARYTLAHRHLAELSRDALASPSALVRAAAARELAGAEDALHHAAVRLADALGGAR